MRLVNRRTAGSGPKSCMVVFCTAASSAARSMHSLGERWHKTALLATSAVQKVAEFFPWPAVNAGVLSTSAHVSSSVHGEPSQPATNGARCCSRTAAGRGLSDTAIKGNSMDTAPPSRSLVRALRGREGIAELLQLAVHLGFSSIKKVSK